MTVLQWMWMFMVPREGHLLIAVTLLSITVYYRQGKFIYIVNFNKEIQSQDKMYKKHIQMRQKRSKLRE